LCYNMREVKTMTTYLFDFDGTIVDSMPTYARVMKKILDDNGIPYGSDLMKKITPLGIIGSADYYVDELGLKMTKEEMIALTRKYLTDEYLYHIPAKHNVVRVLQALKARGDRLNILTASPHITMDPCLKRIGIYDLFENIWSCEDFSTTKSDPEIYKMVADRLGLKVEDVLFLDDNLEADLTAVGAGMRVYGVYDDSSSEYVEEMKAATHGYIYDFEELL